MRRIGKREISLPATEPSADALREAAIHQATAAALSPLTTTGIVKGVYRYRTHEERNRADEAALVRAVAEAVASRAAATRRRR